VRGDANDATTGGARDAARDATRDDDDRESPERCPESIATTGDARAATGRAREGARRRGWTAREDEGLTTGAVSGRTQYVASARGTWAGRRWR